MAREKQAVLRIEGADDILKALKQLEPKFAKKAVRKAMRVGLKPILTTARANAPVKSGKIKKAIKIRAAKRKRNRVGVRIKIGEENFVGKGFYGAFQEFGWKTGSRKSPPDQRTQIEGKHFMENAFDSRGHEAMNLTRDELKKNLDETVKEVAGNVKPKS
jgi:HK97 gp10 family phage protein